MTDRRSEGRSGRGRAWVALVVGLALAALLGFSLLSAAERPQRQTAQGGDGAPSRPPAKSVEERAQRPAVAAAAAASAGAQLAEDEAAAARMYRKIAELLTPERDCDSSGNALSQVLEENADVVERVARQRAGLAEEARRQHDERIGREYREVIERAREAMRESFARCAQSEAMAAALQRFRDLARPAQ